ncbi:MAG: 4a-hydroxytetrahydrobiopterin dehydratase, partial [Planctomycetota bacterium]
CAQLHPDWTVIDGHHLQRRIVFDDFAQALRFANALGAVAEEEQHHPDILLQYGAATVSIFTHAVDGLTEADFVLAAKADRLLE